MASATVRRVLAETAPKRSQMQRRRARTRLLRGWDWTASVALEDLVTDWGDGAMVYPVDSPRHENERFWGGPALG